MHRFSYKIQQVIPVFKIEKNDSKNKLNSLYSIDEQANNQTNRIFNRAGT